MRVHLLHPPPDHALHVLRERIGLKFDVSVGAGVVPSDTAVLVAGRPTREQLLGCPALRALIIPFAGVPDVTRDLLLREFSSLRVYNLHHNAAAAAELALTLLLAAAKTLLPVDRAFRQGDWRSRYNGAPTLLLSGKTALILGLGAIGSRVARACHALDIRVSAVRRDIGKPSPSFVDVHPLSALQDLLPEANAVIVCLPLTPETHGLLGRQEIGLLPASAILVNVARGPIVDEQALYVALRDGRLAGAGLDVWYRYPSNEKERATLLPSAFPFHEMQNVVMSPHRGGAFRLEELEARRMQDLATTLKAIASGGSVPHRVDLEAGY